MTTIEVPKKLFRSSKNVFLISVVLHRFLIGVGVKKRRSVGHAESRSDVDEGNDSSELSSNTDAIDLSKCKQGGTIPCTYKNSEGQLAEECTRGDLLCRGSGGRKCLNFDVSDLCLNLTFWKGTVQNHA